MASNAAVRASNAAIITSHRPLVAVFFAGATGIGHYTLRELARATADTPGAGGLRAYIVARKPDVARAVIAECSDIIQAGVSGVAVADGDNNSAGVGPTAEFVFVKTDDLSLMSEIDRVCNVITEFETTRVAKMGSIDTARVDYLLLTQGYTPYQPRKETKEGLDAAMALLYYSRMRAIVQLMPLLLAASTGKSATGNNEVQQQHLHHATVVSVYAAGMEDNFDASNLALDTPVSAYNYNDARSHMVYMHTLFFEYLAQKHCHGQDNDDNAGSQQSSGTPLLTLAHIMPGLVDGPVFEKEDLPPWFRSVWLWLVRPWLGWLIFRRPEICGANTLSIADGSRFPPAGAAVDSKGSKNAVKDTMSVAGGGTYAIGTSMESVLKPAKYEDIDRVTMREKVWKHTVGVFEAITSGGRVHTGATP